MGGVFVAIEVKTPRGALTPLQQRFLDAVAAAGGVSFVWRTDVPVAEVLDRLRDLARPPETSTTPGVRFIRCQQAGETV